MTPVKKTTRKAATEVKAEPKKPVEAVKTEEPKKAAVPAKKTAAHKAEPKKAAEPVKAEVKKAAEPKKPAAPVATVTVEYNGKQYSAKAVVEQALNVYRDTHKDAEVNTIEVYLQPENHVAYYVINGEGSDDFRIDL
ncbi:MAG: DUF6465 family protein [Clostridiales bacterium]|uniref:DUF6465 family protein n=1 Tax=Chordicoccus furentiruminis TaxID=2709410 RepID=UPI0023A86CCA|nr:DUF6465 family protein [Chordicoccus furentiruminis]MCI6173870.1 DUF6465 family protein [Clostridiales bacterium]